MLKNHNVHVIATYALLILAAPLLLTSIASAQAVNCPTGYSCTPIPQVPGCPVGYLCLPLTTSSGSGAFLNTTNSGGSSSGGYYSGTTGSGYATGGSISSCYVYSRNLSIGSSGQDVAALQSFLIRNGFNIPNVANRLVAAGSFGTNTASALSRYQAVNGIAENGQFGSITRAKLNSWCCNTATATPAVPVAPTTAVSPVYNSPANPVNTPPSTINLTSPTLTAPAVSTLPPTTSFTISSASITLGQAANLTSVTNSPSATLKSAAIDQSTDNVNWTSGTPCGYWNSTTGRDNTHTISCSLLPGAAGTYYFRSRGTENNGTS
ncbi:MAG: peptidoglycan-binding protein, partial [Candidatus Taylorbacteria bacterium]|nr:peptidoglycan-binding protein [Candidatus Taylorbacteria bacterium]